MERCIIRKEGHQNECLRLYRKAQKEIEEATGGLIDKIPVKMVIETALKCKESPIFYTEQSFLISVRKARRLKKKASPRCAESLRLYTKAQDELFSKMGKHASLVTESMIAKKAISLRESPIFLTPHRYFVILKDLGAI